MNFRFRHFKTILLTSVLTTAIGASVFFLRDQRFVFHLPEDSETMILSLSADSKSVVISGEGFQSISKNFASVSDIEIFGNPKDNLLTVDFSNGDPIPKGGLAYHGLEEETPQGDALHLAGKKGGSTGYQPVTEKDGILRVGGTGTHFSLIAFTGLEPVIDTIISSSLNVNGTNGNNAISITDASSTARSIVAIDSFETIEFENKTTLRISASGGADTITLIEPNGATGLTNIEIDGQIGDDTFDLVSTSVDTALTDVEFMEVNGLTPGSATAAALEIQGVTLTVDIAGTAPGAGYDQITATNVNLSNAILQIDDSFVPATDDEFTIIDSSSPITGTFISLPEGATFPAAIGGRDATITYIGGDGNDVVLTIIEEPTPPAAPTPISDVRVGKNANASSHSGNDIYNDSGSGQTLGLRISENQKRGKFFFSTQLDSSSVGDILLSASRSNRNMKIAYRQINPAGDNVTGAITRSVLIVEGTVTTAFQGKIEFRRERSRRTLSIFGRPGDAPTTVDRVQVKLQ